MVAEGLAITVLGAELQARLVRLNSRRQKVFTKMVGLALDFQLDAVGRLDNFLVVLPTSNPLWRSTVMLMLRSVSHLPWGGNQRG